MELNENENFPIQSEVSAKTRFCMRGISNSVAHEIIINLESFELPGTAQSVVFRFINPLWAWVMAANKMHMQGHEMFFSPKAMFDEETGDRLYGAGVSFGEKLKLAAARTPVGGKPALFGLR